MNPRKNYEDTDKETTRAFIELFITHGDLFKFAIDSGVSDDEELRAFIIENDYSSTEDGKSTICISGINQTENVNKIYNILQDMGLKIIENTEEYNYHDSIGDYTSNTIKSFSPNDIESEWNVPHLLVYGSLAPEIKEACQRSFGNKYEYYNIRNHYVIRGEELDPSIIDSLSHSMDNTNMFEDDKQFYKSNLRTADYI